MSAHDEIKYKIANACLLLPGWSVFSEEQIVPMIKSFVGPFSKTLYTCKLETPQDSAVPHPFGRCYRKYNSA